MTTTVARTTVARTTVARTTVARTTVARTTVLAALLTAAAACTASPGPAAPTTSTAAPAPTTSTAAPAPTTTKVSMDPDEAQFLSQLDSFGIDHPDVDAVVADGRTVCAKLDGGQSAYFLLLEMSSNSSERNLNDSGALLISAIRAFCPVHSDQMRPSS